MQTFYSYDRGRVVSRLIGAESGHSERARKRRPLSGSTSVTRLADLHVHRGTEVIARPAVREIKTQGVKRDGIAASQAYSLRTHPHLPGRMATAVRGRRKRLPLQRSAMIAGSGKRLMSLPPVRRVDRDICWRHRLGVSPTICLKTTVKWAWF
jgi:hypothetical protein